VDRRIRIRSAGGPEWVRGVLAALISLEDHPVIAFRLPPSATAMAKAP
jgi:hypothetical protein